jgi:signal transduction histidine kinase/CheY-like chemotaxis protein
MQMNKSASSRRASNKRNSKKKAAREQLTLEIERRDIQLDALNNAAAVLLQSETGEFESDILRCLAIIGEAVAVDRVYIWKNHKKESKLCCSQLYEWSGGAEPLQGSELTIDVPYGDRVPGWEETLSSGNCIVGLVRDMSLAEQAQLSAQGILSIFVLPVFVRDQFWGFVGYDDCHSERIFSENELSFLRLGGLMIASALMRREVTTNTLVTAAKLEAVISNYSGIIWSVDRNNIITLLNGLYIKEFGITPASFEGWKLEAAQRKNHKLDVIGNVRKTFSDGPQDWVAEAEGKMFHAHTTPIFDGNNCVTDVVGSIDDITKIVRLQAELETALREAQDANQAKSSFLARMSHEMRTPLNAIIGLSNLILEAGGLSEEANSNLEKVHDAGMTLLSTVNDVLDISKIEAGKLELTPIDYDLPSLINDTVTQSIMHIGEKPVKFTLNVDENLPARLYGDDLRIKQIINNILSNAFKYTNEGAVEMGVNCARDGETVWLAVWVRDTGIGVRQEDMDSLFSDYTQINSDFNRNILGTGLGLPITKKMAEMMDGSIAVESEYGKGSVFTVKLRQGHVGEAVIGLETAGNLMNFRYSDSKRVRNLQLARINLPYARVLVVDDVRTNLDVAKGLMKPYRMRIDCVTSGQQAIDAIREEAVRYSAVFMDHMMPEMDGIEAVRIIREEIGTEYAKTVPIIALTANAIVGNKEMFLRQGFQAFLSKPIDIAQLDAVIREWVRDARRETTPADDPPAQDMRRAERDRRTFGKLVAGLDIGKGIERFGDDEEAFLQILRSYATNTKPLLEVAKGVNEANLGDYAITVHGIKASSRGICAEPAGTAAEALEGAAKSGDFGFVRDNNPAFVEIVGNLIRDIDDMLCEVAEDNPKPEKDELDQEALSRLLTACENYDMDGVDAAMAEIEGYQYKSEGGLVVWLRENVDSMNFAQIKERLSEVIN